jgi:hypothetical protein
MISSCLCRKTDSFEMHVFCLGRGGCLIISAHFIIQFFTYSLSSVVLISVQ